MTALQYLESSKNAHPELAEWYNSLADLYQKKLWHQLTQKLEQFVALAVFQVPFFSFYLMITALVVLLVFLALVSLLDLENCSWCVFFSGFNMDYLRFSRLLSIGSMWVPCVFGFSSFMDQKVDALIDLSYPESEM